MASFAKDTCHQALLLVEQKSMTTRQTCFDLLWVGFEYIPHKLMLKDLDLLRDGELLKGDT